MKCAKCHAWSRQQYSDETLNYWQSSDTSPCHRFCPGSPAENALVKLLTFFSELEKSEENNSYSEIFALCGPSPADIQKNLSSAPMKFKPQVKEKKSIYIGEQTSQ
jgi:hypothetical protein